MKSAFVQMSFSVVGVSVVNKNDIAFTAHVYNSAVYFLYFIIKTPFRGTVSDIVTVFASDISESERSMADLDI